ncbi:NAD-dependent epimerase/dehydratase family protein [Allorhizocola rhizosphaerae]|uniref:NAD-dependent epimerase/dehydratase family protein n=1 Tax=Allorhizocola rhizosphaerae TaxID=1872709 RepID=UPI000E3E8EB4|nr:NAD(P)-dependent oxidoreductase [Allorhizocola rhizosphaerae]
MRILLAGATGAIGRPLTTALTNAGHEVLTLSRTAGDIRADALDREALLRALRGRTADAVIHQLTALKQARRTVDANDPSTVLRIKGTANLIEAAQLLGAQRFLVQSLVLGYGYLDHGDRPLTETDPFGVKTGGPADPVVDGLVSAERQAFAVDGIALRYGVFFGPGTWFSRGRFPVPLRGGVVPWVHVRDAAAATVLALERGAAREAYNICMENPATWREMAGRHGLPLPGRLLRAAVPYLGAAMIDTSMRVSNAKARNELGWEPVAGASSPPR